MKWQTYFSLFLLISLSLFLSLSAYFFLSLSSFVSTHSHTHCLSPIISRALTGLFGKISHWTGGRAPEKAGKTHRARYPPFFREYGPATDFTVNLRFIIYTHSPTTFKGTWGSCYVRVLLRIWKICWWSPLGRIVSNVNADEPAISPVSKILSKLCFLFSLFLSYGFVFPCFTFPEPNVVREHQHWESKLQGNKSTHSPVMSESFFFSLSLSHVGFMRDDWVYAYL